MDGDIIRIQIIVFVFVFHCRQMMACVHNHRRHSSFAIRRISGTNKSILFWMLLLLLLLLMLMFTITASNNSNAQFPPAQQLPTPLPFPMAQFAHFCAGPQHQQCGHHHRAHVIDQSVVVGHPIGGRSSTRQHVQTQLNIMGI